MLNRIVDFTLEEPLDGDGGRDRAVLAGGWALFTIPVEAFPDLTNNQVVVVTEAPSLPPTEMEQLVTYPIERAMLGLPKQEEVRSLSKLGLSMVTVVFDDSVPMYFGAAARQRTAAADFRNCCRRACSRRSVCRPPRSASCTSTRSAAT